MTLLALLGTPMVSPRNNDMIELLEPEWEAEPVGVHGLSCRVAKVPSGWIICHDKNARFCFSGDTRDMTIAKARFVWLGLS
jgi:hypothetical protein